MAAEPTTELTNARICPKCGAETRKGASFCGRCGAKLPSTRDAAPGRSPPGPGSEGGDAAQSSAEEKLATTYAKETRYPGRRRKLLHVTGALLIGTSLVVGTWYYALSNYRKNSPGTEENRSVAKTGDADASEIKRAYDFAMKEHERIMRQLTPVPSISASEIERAWKEHERVIRQLTPIPSIRVPVDLTDTPAASGNQNPWLHATPRATTNDAGKNQGNYVGERYPEVRNRLLGDEEAARMSYAELRYAINEVYARYGAEFATQPEIQNRFRQFAWYRPRRGVSLTQIETEFTFTERTNVELLARYRDLKKPR